MLHKGSYKYLIAITVWPVSSGMFCGKLSLFVLVVWNYYQREAK